MNKNQKMIIMVGFIFAMCGAMLVLSADYTKDKPLIDAQNRQNAISNVDMNPQDIVSSMKKFANDTLPNLQRPMP